MGDSTMKKYIALCIVATFLFLSACTIPTDKILISLGSYETKEFYTSGGFQDYTDYAKYTYKDIDLDGNKYFKQIDDLNQWNLILHIENFEDWIDTIGENDPNNEVVVNYDFDFSFISDTDYYCIYKDPNSSGYENYDVYFIDMETNTLYFFHNNI